MKRLMSTARRDRWLAINFAATIFVSAFLLFQIQPLVSKYILPWFGGSPAVWTTCMLFFQTLLFGGYAYAHLSQRYLRPKLQGLVHLGLLVLALLLLRVVPAESWKPTDSNHPVEQILLLLTASVGVPYFVLSSTGPLIQSWFARSFPGRIPYRLYALSNFGSLLALLSYPFLFERLWDVPQQAGFWSWGFVVYAALCAYAAVSVWMLVRREPGIDRAAPINPALVEGEAAGLELASPADLQEGGRKPDDYVEAISHTPGWHRALWLALPAFASVALLATTNHVSTDVAPVPFLWVVPLSLYLLTFVIAFDHSSRYRPAWIAGLTLPSVYFVAAVIYCGLTVNLFDCGIPGKLLHAISDQWAQWRGLAEDKVPKALELPLGYGQYVALNFEAMFAICMLCHGELVRLRPHPRHLTAYYLMIAAGGALGGVAVTLVAPLIFQTFVEFNLALVGGYLLAIVILVRSIYQSAGDRNAAARRGRRWWMAPAGGVLLLLLAGIGLCDLPHYFDESNSHRQLAVRNFFGTLSVLRHEADNLGNLYYTLKHGGITHGIQFTDPERRIKPTTYYSEESGVGRTIGYFRQHGSKGGLRVGAVGLGTGTVAAYIDQGDQIRFYEINPAVIEIAESGNWFTYLKDCKQRGGNYEIVLGDARLTLERELKEHKPQRYQVLVLDAFSGDAIPVHLLTEEAFRIYLEYLATLATDGEDGAIAIHISNRYLDLEPVVRGAAEKFKLRQVRIISTGESKIATMTSDWIILTRNKELADALEANAVKPNSNPRPPVVWTDSRSNLFDLLK